MSDFLAKYPSEMGDEQLARYITEQITHDISWRRDHVDLEKCVKLYEAYSGTKFSDDLPEENMIRGAIEDALSVALMNMPKARLKAIQDFTNVENVLERDLRAKTFDQTERTINSYVKTILTESQYDDMLQQVLTDSAIFGVGYLLTEVEDRASLRDSYELRELMKTTDEWTHIDAKRFRELVKKIRVTHIDSRDVFFQHSIREVGPQMLRVSVIKRYTTDSLRRKWKGNKFSEVGEIKPGAWPYYIQQHENPSELKESEKITAEITTWMLEPYVMEKSFTFTNEEGKEVKEKFPAVESFRMTKVVVAGGKLVKRETQDYDETIGRLPLIPFYLRRSKNHPYGYSHALQLEYSQRFYNLLKAIQYKGARKSVSNQAVAVMIPTLGDGDEEQLDYVLENGGVAKLKGNKVQGPQDVKEMVMPLNYMSAGIQPAIQQAMMMERKAFEDQAQSLDLEALGRARSGAGKRAQASANDRTKTISLGNLSKSVEDVYDTIYELIRCTYKEPTKVSVRREGGLRENVTLNDPYEREIPYMDENGEVYMDPQDPTKLYTTKVNFKINDTSILMVAEADGRGNIPLEPVSRLQYAMMLQQGGHISAKYARELTLDEDMIARDDQLRREEQQEQQAMQQEMMQAMQQAQGPTGDSEGRQAPMAVGQDGMPPLPNMPEPEAMVANLQGGNVPQ